MIRPESSLLSDALRHPESLATWPLPHWDLLIRQARSANLLARLAVLLDDTGTSAKVPAAPRAHLAAAHTLALSHRDAMLREIARVRTAMAPTGVPVVLLKGAAYLSAGLPTARGRLFSDIDILVPKAALSEVEAALMLHGWHTTHHHPYDQRYYRQWMHELPPLRHVTRLTVVDVHHGIVPRTSRVSPDPERLLAASRPAGNEPAIRVLAPPDMVLHSATHLFHNEDLKNGLRDLADLDSLLRHFGREPHFWDELAPRAAELDLLVPLRSALRYCARILGTPIPQAIRSAVGADADSLRDCLVDRLWMRGLRPDHPSASDWFTGAARGLLYLHGHWLKMPAWLLARHLTIKALRQPR